MHQEQLPVVLLVQVQLLPFVPDRFDPLVKIGIARDRGEMLGQLGRKLALQFLAARGRIRSRDGKEGRQYLVQSLARRLERGDGILEIGLCRVFDDRGNLRIVQGQRGFQRRAIILVRDQVEGGQLKRRFPVIEKRVAHVSDLLCGKPKPWPPPPPAPHPNYCPDRPDNQGGVSRRFYASRPKARHISSSRHAGRTPPR